MPERRTFLRLACTIFTICVAVAGWAAGGESAIAAPERQGGAWQRIETTNSPPARRDAALGYDATRNRLILFGGRGPEATYGDTWGLDLETHNWTQLTTGDAPPARFGMVSGVDEERQRFLISTGQMGSTLYNDLWAFDFRTDQWAQVGAAGQGPSLRYGAAGGVSADGDAFMLSHGFTDQGRFDDSWRLDLATDTWQEITPADTRPLPRCLHAGTATRSGLLLFGGCASGYGPCPLDDAWLLDEASGQWNEIDTPAEIQARTYPAIVRLGASDTLLLFGGDGTGPLGDSWLLDGGTRQWSPVTGEGPDARSGHSMVWAQEEGGALLFGGAAGATHFDDLWLFEPEEESPQPRRVFLPFSVSTARAEGRPAVTRLVYCARDGAAARVTMRFPLSAARLIFYSRPC